MGEKSPSHQTLGREFVKLRLKAPDGTVETPWAVDLGEGLYRLDNIPFFAYGVSADVVIQAAPEDDGYLAFSKLVTRSGNRTLRIAFKDKVTKTEPLLIRLSEIGVGWEGAFSKLIALNVPPEVDLDRVVDLLTRSGENWEYANPTWEELHPGE